MKLILEEAEIQAAVKAYMGADYDIKDLKVVVGRTKSSTRIEVEVERSMVQATPVGTLKREVEVAQQKTTTNTPKQSAPFFTKLSED